MVEQTDAYLSAGGEVLGYIARGKTFVILGEQDGWLHIRLAGVEYWIRASRTDYLPQGQAPPGPIACVAPHWPDRTPDRKTGFNEAYGERTQWIFPDGTLASAGYVEFRHTHTSQLLTQRDGRISGISEETGLITLDLGNGLVVRRKWTERTQVIMIASVSRVGMTYDEIKPLGGTLCDLEVGDAVAILHPSEAEGASPSPEGDLWGVLIAQ